jgi:hypothetical protein
MRKSEINKMSNTGLILEITFGSLKPKSYSKLSALSKKNTKFD